MITMIMNAISMIVISTSISIINHNINKWLSMISIISFIKSSKFLERKIFTKEKKATNYKMTM